MLWGNTTAVSRQNAEHAHDMHEFVICLSEAGIHSVAAQDYRFRAGRTFFLPSGVPHYVVGTPEEPACIGFVCFDDFSFIEPESSLQRVIRRLVEDQQYVCGHTGQVRRVNVRLARQLHGELDALRPFSQSMVRSILTQLLVHHCRGLGHESGPEPGRWAERVGQMRKWIVLNCAEPIRLDDVARRAGMSRTLFSREFRRYTGMTLVEFVQAARIDLAMKRLARTGETVTRLAYACGFNNLGHFHRVFRRLTHLTPQQYRNVVGKRGPYVQKIAAW